MKKRIFIYLEDSLRKLILIRLQRFRQTKSLMSFKKIIAASFGLNIFTFVAGFANSVISTRMLGPEGRGQLAIYTSAVELFALVLGLGLPQALVYFSAKDVNNRSKLLNSALLFLVLSTIVFLILLKISFLLGLSHLLLPAPYDNGVFQFTISAYFLCLSGWYIMVSILNGHKLFMQTSFIGFISLSGTLLIYFLLFLYTKNFPADFKVNTFYWAQLVVAVMVLAACFLYYQKLVSKNEKFSLAILSTSELSSLLKYGIVYYFSNLMLFISTKLDYWFVDFFEGPKELGIYVLASNVGLLILLLPNSIGLMVSSFKAGSDRQDMEAQTAKLCRVTFFVSLMIGLFLWLFGKHFIVLVYGDAFARSAAALNILLIGVIPLCVFTVLRGYYAGAGKLPVILKATGIGFVLTIFLDVVLIKPYGIIGASVASAIAYSMSTFYLVYSFDQPDKWQSLLMIRKDDLAEFAASFKAILFRR